MTFVLALRNELSNKLFRHTPKQREILIKSNARITPNFHMLMRRKKLKDRKFQTLLVFKEVRGKGVSILFLS